MREATHKSAKTESLFLDKIPKVVKFIEAESKTVLVRDCEVKGTGSYYSMDTEFQFGMMKKEMDNDKGCTTM